MTVAAFTAWGLLLAVVPTAPVAVLGMLAVLVVFALERWRR